MSSFTASHRTFSNELISRDEGMHTEFGIMMYNKEERYNLYKLISNYNIDIIYISKDVINLLTDDSLFVKAIFSAWINPLIVYMLLGCPI